MYIKEMNGIEFVRGWLHEMFISRWICMLLFAVLLLPRIYTYFIIFGRIPSVHTIEFKL